MQLVLTTRGALLRVRDGCFQVRAPKPKTSPNEETEFAEHTFSPKKVEGILVGSAATLTTEALSLAVKHNVEVLLLDEFGDPECRVWHCRFGSTATIRRRQLEAETDGKGARIAREWIGAKIGAQAEFLARLFHARPAREEEGAGRVEELRGLGRRALEAAREELLGLEAQAARAYFGILADLIPDAWRFAGRSRSPAKDPFNCFLNYAYGVLYGRVEKACIIAGLDPYVGFLHVDGHGRKALVFDLIEPFRHLADETVFYLFSGRQVRQEMCEAVPGGFSLAKEGKEVLIAALFARFEKGVRYRGRNIQEGNVIQFEAHRVAAALLDKESEGFDQEVVEV
ncbi:MAG: CRISPR-associated endonuclease Cas1 [Planctomycetes bacterium]|nr:CRISPR-associated endonuclease Cas1 [Planctomycetota bacterium]